MVGQLVDALDRDHGRIHVAHQQALAPRGRRHDADVQGGLGASAASTRARISHGRRHLRPAARRLRPRRASAPSRRAPAPGPQPSPRRAAPAPDRRSGIRREPWRGLSSKRPGHASGRSMTGLIVIGRPDGERQVGAGAAPGRGRARRGHQRRQHAAVSRSARSSRRARRRRTRRARRTGCTASWMPPIRRRSGAGCSSRGRRSARRWRQRRPRDRGRRHRALSACPAAWSRAGPGHAGPDVRGAARARLAALGVRRHFMPSSPGWIPAMAARLRPTDRQRLLRAYEVVVGDRALARGLAGHAAAARRACRRGAAASR